MGSLPAQWKASIPFLCSVTYDNTTPASQISLHRFLYQSLTYLTIWVDRNIPRVGWVSVPQLTLHQRRMRKWLLEKALVGVIFPVLFALGTAAHEAGNPIILNGSQKSSNLQYCNRVFDHWRIGVCLLDYYNFENIILDDYWFLV
jgi:hypothetical protein